MYKQILQTQKDIQAARALLREHTGKDWEMRAHLNRAIGRLEQLLKEVQDEKQEAMTTLVDQGKLVAYLESNGHSTLARFARDE